MTTTTDFDEGFISLKDAEALVLETTQWRGTDVEFSDDGERWSLAWLPGEGAVGPALARATVKRLVVTYGRDDTVIATETVPTTVVVRWAEYYPEQDDAAAKRWAKLATIMLRKVAIMLALRTAFRDVLGGRLEPAEMDQAIEAPAERHWPTEVAACTTVAEVEALYAEARAARAMTPTLIGLTLEKAFKARRAELIEAEAAAVAEDVEPHTPTPADVAKPRAVQGPVEAAMAAALDKRSRERAEKGAKP